MIARGNAWLPGVCMVAGGACMVARGHAWLLGGWGMCGEVGCAWQRGGGWQRGEACVAKSWHAWDMTRYGDTINERVVRILLECILVY